MVQGVRIREGATELLVPEQHSSGGPGKIFDTVFFNEQMALNRDVSIMFLRALGRKLKVADCMTATGSRAVRIANEVPDTEVVANDINPGTVPYIEENVRLNNLTNCRVSRENLHVLLAKEVFDYVDLDPFGSPVPFLHSAIQGCKRGGILAVTATDTAPLAGAHRAKCERRYQARPIRGPMCHEGALRILIGYVAREAAKFDKGIRPMLSFSADHYVRTYVELRNGAGAADECLSKMVYMSYDPDTLERSISPTPDEKHVYGPMWGGPLFDRDILGRMSPEGMAEEKRCAKLLDIWREEIDSNPFMYDMSEVASNLKVSTPRYDTFMEEMARNGRVSRTHISPTGFKTELPVNRVKEIFLSVSGKD